METCIWLSEIKYRHHQEPNRFMETTSEQPILKDIEKECEERICDEQILLNEQQKQAEQTKLGEQALLQERNKRLNDEQQFLAQNQALNEQIRVLQDQISEFRLKQPDVNKPPSDLLKTLWKQIPTYKGEHDPVKIETFL